MAEASAQTQAEIPVSPPLSRREFLYYTWGLSMVVFLAASGGALLWYTFPRFREGEFGGVFDIPVDQIPPPDARPLEFSEGRFWMVNIGPTTVGDNRQPGDYPLTEGVKAIFKVCTHLGCLYRWNAPEDRFECPCHGSKFLKSASRIGGPARRNLDVFMIEAVDAQGNVLARTEPSMGRLEGEAVAIPPGTVSIKIDTGRRVVGAPNSKPGGGL
ncbi:MAG: Rieske 2Fe-2S domain-containing protein [Anaerolineales bacterium]|nr:Rieske 2Fe-2S domain-containing protein [Anaerolineales bacterium]